VGGPARGVYARRAVSFDLTDPQQLALRAPAYELAFDQAGHALEAQQRMAGDLTSRAGMLMATAAVTTSIFGGQLLAHGHRNPAAWVALAAFLGVGLTVVDVLWPRHDWEFETGRQRDPRRVRGACRYPHGGDPP
jgi:hypothetical protein